MIKGGRPSGAQVEPGVHGSLLRRSRITGSDQACLTLVVMDRLGTVLVPCSGLSGGGGRLGARWVVCRCLG
jgi:hypothetical protein